MATISKKEIAELIAQKTNFTQTDIKTIIDCFIEEIKEQFRQKNKIEIRWFGTFYPHYKRPRTYKVPKTGGERTMPGRLTLRFKTSKQMFIYKEEVKKSK